ncbi:MAG: Hint domain-containing protein [Acidiphilium sp.]
MSSTVTVGVSIGAVATIDQAGSYDLYFAQYPGVLNIALNSGTVDITGFSGQTASAFLTNDLSGGGTEIIAAPLYLSGANFNLGLNDVTGSTVGSGTLELASSLAPGGAAPNINFDGPNDALILDPIFSPSNLGVINDFGPSDTIVLRGVTNALTPVWTQNSGGGGTLNIDNGASVAASLTLATGSFTSAAFNVTTDASGGEAINVTCFCPGTNIATPDGPVAVEQLAIGDPIITRSGATRPIKWIGRRTYAARFATGNLRLAPVCVRAGALSDARPQRDLWISPQHALFINGALIPVALLINGSTILQPEITGDITYYHIELDNHDVLLAEGAPAETYVNDDNRLMFHNADTYAALYPGAEPPARYCAERLLDGPKLASIRSSLATRAHRPHLQAANPLQGHLDTIRRDATGTTLTGWAQSPDTTELPVCLDIMLAGRRIARTLANLYRPDLETAGLGSGRHGFAITLPHAVISPQTDLTTLRLRRSADQHLLSSAATTLIDHIAQPQAAQHFA